MGYAIMRLEKVKTYTEINARLKHNHRIFNTAFKTDVKNPPIMVNDNNKTDYKELLESKVNHTIRKDAVRAVEIICSFSSDSQPKDLKAWIGENVNWIGENFGGNRNIYDVSLHLDETTPHLHIVIMPLTDGKLSCFHYINGKKDLIRLQNSYAEKMKQFGLERGKSREETKAYHTNTKDYIAKKVEELEHIEQQERKKYMKKLYDEIEISPNFAKYDEEFERER